MAFVSRRRDASLALVTLTLILAISFLAGRTAGLTDGSAVVVGVGVVFVAELIAYRYREAVRVMWARGSVQWTAVCCAVLTAGVAGYSASSFLVGAIAWGVFAYLLLLGVVAARGYASEHYR